MGVLEIISGVLLILCSIAIIVMVLFQESKGNGLSGAIAGGEMMGNEGALAFLQCHACQIHQVCGHRVLCARYPGGRHQHLSEISQKKARQLLAGFFAIYLRRPGKSIVMCVE